MHRPAARTSSISPALPSGQRAVRLPLVVTVEEFALCVRFEPEVVRRKIRAGEIVAYNRPYRIPSAELLKYGIKLEDAAIFLHELNLRQSAA